MSDEENFGMAKLAVEPTSVGVKEFKSESRVSANAAQDDYIGHMKDGCQELDARSTTYHFIDMLLDY